MDDILKSLFNLDLLVNYSVGYLTIYQISQLCDYNLVTTTTNTKFEKIKQKTIGACKFSDKWKTNEKWLWKKKKKVTILVQTLWP